LRCKDQEHEDQRHSKYNAGTALRSLLLIAHRVPGEGHVIRQYFARDLFEGRERLSGAIARSGLSLNFRGTEQVEAVGELGSLCSTDTDECRERNHVPFRVSRVEEAEGVFVLAIGRLRLDVNLVETPKAIEIVHVGSAQERAYRRIHFLQGHAELEYLGVVDVEEDLGRVRPEETARPADLGSLHRRPGKVLQLFFQIGRIIPPSVLNHHRETGPGTETRNGRRSEHECIGLHDIRRETGVDSPDEFPRVILCIGPYIPILQLQKDEARIGLYRSRDEIEARDRHHILDRIEARNDLRDVLHHPVGTLEGAGVGQTHSAHHVALILLGHEASGYDLKQQKQSRNDRREKHTRPDQLLDEEASEAHVTTRYGFEATVEPDEEGIEPTLLGFPRRPEEHGRECGTQSERVERGDRDRDRDRDCELLIESAGNAGHGRDGHEDRDQRK